MLHVKMTRMAVTMMEAKMMIDMINVLNNMMIILKMSVMACSLFSVTVPMQKINGDEIN